MSEEGNLTPQGNDSENTQTKKTIRLRPLTPKPAPIPLVKPVVPAAADNTQTQKTVKLKPLMPKIASTNRTVDPLEIRASAKSALDGNDTQTRHAIQMSKAPATVKPATIDIGSAKAPASGSADDDRTVKVKRPAPAAPAESAPRPALKFNRPATPSPVAAPKPATAVIPPKPVAAFAPQVEADDDDIEFEDDEPNKLQVALSVVAAVALLISGTLLALSFFNVKF